ncbi:MAG: 16S rRNA (cytosine(1402)-N(4))-methyltransferase RsmH [Bacteroidota bacterium]|nr:16S rRNA (cytosine(1402)-N(4))-methyltransferase RsmH [Bacteroidota bacterium]
MQEYHIPVLLFQSVDFLIGNKSGVYFDGTIGFGGHSAEFLKHLTQDAKLLATEVDIDAYNFCKDKFKDDRRVKLYNTNFSQIDIVSKIDFVEHYDGIFADLGVSSFQLDNPLSGFTYRTESPLDLRLDKSRPLSASDVINDFDENELSRIFFEFGEEKYSRKIARKIVEKRQQKRISTTTDLSKIIEEITPKPFLIKSLSRVFQALRIFVNDELGVLKEFLTKSVDLLNPGGNIVILTYHSLEDRIVKEVFKYESLSCVCPPGFPVCVCDKTQRLEILTRKPVLPDENELNVNSRARSAKLRAARRK